MNIVENGRIYARGDDGEKASEVMVADVVEFGDAVPSQVGLVAKDEVKAYMGGRMMELARQRRSNFIEF